MTTTTVDAAAEAQAPALRVLSGNPSEEDLAILVLVMSALSGGGDEEAGADTFWNRRKGMQSRGVVDQRGNWAGSLLRI